MARKPAPLVPRKVAIHGEVRWEVRVPTELHQQEKSARPRFLKESEAKGYCHRLKADLIRYSDKARGLTDAQKIEAQACFERLAPYAASLTRGRSAGCPGGPCRLLLPGRRVGRAGDRRQAETRRTWEQRAAPREIRERLRRFARAFGDRLVSDLEAAEIRAWLLWT